MDYYICLGTDVLIWQLNYVNVFLFDSYRIVFYRIWLGFAHYIIGFPVLSCVILLCNLRSGWQNYLPLMCLWKWAVWWFIIFIFFINCLLAKTNYLPKKGGIPKCLSCWVSKNRLDAHGQLAMCTSDFKESLKLGHLHDDVYITQILFCRCLS